MDASILGQRSWPAIINFEKLDHYLICDQKFYGNQTSSINICSGLTTLPTSIIIMLINSVITCYREQPLITSPYGVVGKWFDLHKNWQS